MKIAICQPTFLPWIGYFALMSAVDEFVFLDHVAFDKRSWQQRNQIKTARGPQWITVPVSSTQGQTIDTIQINGRIDKIVKAIEHNYSKAPYFQYYGRTIIKILEQDHRFLCSLNFHLIEYFIKVLDIKTKFKCSSQMDLKGKKADLLAEICEQRGAKEYISPPGSKDYLEEYNFPIPVKYFDYQHPIYNQLHTGFTPYMSVIDLLFNEGPESMSIIRRGYEAGGNSGKGGVEADSEQEHKGIPRKADNGLLNRSGETIGAV